MIDSPTSSSKADEQPQFEIGLTLAGAVSASAYTAGVLDFLFQSLLEWEKQRGLDGVPRHRVVLNVIAGASAGAIVGAHSVIDLARGFNLTSRTPEEIGKQYPSYHSQNQPYRCVLPALWRACVEIPDLLPDEYGEGGFLGLNDLKKLDKAVASVLDSTLLDRIKNEAFAPPNAETKCTSAPPYEFISSALHVYMTLSNMRGIPYAMGFGRPQNKYGMLTHGDRVHYLISDLGNAEANDSLWLQRDAEDAAVRLSIKTLLKSPGIAICKEWDAYGTAALASGAFPIGLAPRELSFEAKNYLRRQLPVDLPSDLFLKPDLPADLDSPNSTFTFPTVDGGMINNNPFDYAQYAIFGGAATEAERRGCGKAIIMVAPFPEPPQMSPEGVPASSLRGILAVLFPALLNQVRFRISDLASAVDERDYSRFLVSPRRQIPRDTQPTDGSLPPKEERYALACGLLSGFGGYLDKEFRSHDFQLGRRNCQLLLRKFLSVRPAPFVEGTPLENGEIPIIPLLGSAAVVVSLPQWPQISIVKLDKICEHIARRLDKVTHALIRDQTKSRFLRTALWIGWLAFLRRPSRAYVGAVILSDLIRRRQIEEYDTALKPARMMLCLPGDPDQTAAIVAELSNPSFRFRTVQGISKAATLLEGMVEETLSKLSGASAPALIRTWRGRYGWTFWSKRPPPWQRWPVLQDVLEWWNYPTQG